MKPRSGLPGWARLLLRIGSPAVYREAFLGDLEERWEEMAGARTGRRRWLLRQVMGSVFPGLRARARELTTQRGGGGNTMETIHQDLRHALRSLGRTPGFTGLATLTLAIAIGVTTAIFSIVNVVAFSELPWQDPDRIAFVWSSDASLQDMAISYPDFVDIRERQRSFQGLAAMRPGQWVLTGGEEPRRIAGFRVTANLPEEWGVRPTVGRVFTADEDLPGAEPVAMLAHWVWESEYGRSPDVVGRVLRLDGVPHTIIGVMPPGLEFGEIAGAEVWVPMRSAATDADRAVRDALVSGRLLPGVTVERASQDIATLGRALAAEYPDADRGRVYEARSARDSLLSDNVKSIMILLVGAVAMVLLVACANVANMLLARGSVRARELAVRSVLGAGRGRLVRQLLTESLVLSAAAALLGLIVAAGLMKLFVRMTQGLVTLFTMAELDGHVLLFVMSVTLATPLLVGLLPAVRASAGRPAEALKDRSAGSGGGGRSGSRLRGALVGAQVAFAVMLMIGAGLSARSVGYVRGLDPGFGVEGLLSARILRPEGSQGPTELVRFFDEVEREIRALPGAEGVAFTSALPLVQPGLPRGFDLEGSVARTDERPTAQTYSVSSAFFAVAGIPLLQGRAFQEEDRGDAPPVMIVNRAAADLCWPGRDPVGTRVRIGDPGTAPWRTVVGVVGNVGRNDRSWEHIPELYVPFAQVPQAGMSALVRAREPERLAGALRAAVWAVDGGQPVDGVKTIARVIDDAQSVDSVLMLLFGTFALFALCMSALGLYGVVSYAVSRRTGEIGIRMALGAERSHVRGMVLGQGARPVLVGGTIGLFGAYLVTRIIQSMVVGVSALDPLTWIGVPAVLALAALAANLVPALRATRVDPLMALRAE
jgi:putative ABC transport system permease protein